MHGMLKSMVEGHTKKHLDIPRIQEIKGMAGKFLTPNCVLGLIPAEIALRRSWSFVPEHTKQVVPYKILPPAVASVKQVVASRLKLFNDAVEWAQGV
jgi:fructose-bisphosphate aldolase, class II